MSLCAGYEVFGGNLYGLIGGAVLGSLAALGGFFFGTKSKTSEDWRNALYVKTSLALLSFFIYAECIFSIFAIPCQFNVIRILGAGNLDTVGGYQVFDITWIKIFVSFLYLILAFHDYHRYEVGHWYMMVGNAGAFTALGFGISRTTSFDFLWFAAAMMLFIGILMIAMRLAASKVYRWRDWKLYVSELPVFVYMAGNFILVMVANPIYHIQGSRFQAFLYPTVTFITAIMAAIVLIFLYKKRVARNGLVASLHGELATKKERDEAKRARAAIAPGLFNNTRS
jgi:hypothetical protein